MVSLYPTFIPSYIIIIILFGTLFLYLKKETSFYYSKLITKGLGCVTGYSLYMALRNYNPKLQLIKYVTVIILILISFLHSKERVEYQEKNK